MASTASGSQTPSASTSTNADVSGDVSEQAQQRPQAGPLPVKAPRLVGEIGYQDISEQTQDLQEDVDLADGPEVDDDDSMEGLNAAEADARNGRHPADRSHINLTSPSTTTLPPPPSQHSASDSVASLNTTSKRSIFSCHSLVSKSYGGITLKTLLHLHLLLLFLGGLIVAWVFAAQRLNQVSTATRNPNIGGTSSIFIHVAFAVAVLVTLIFVERALFQLRAERYAHVHPSEILPSQRHRTGSAHPYGGSTGMAFAPWNRPPLPTYAAALGVRGTGDVEDSIIAAPPPPAYGNTRGSTLLLASLVRNSRGSNRLRASREAPWQVVGRPGVDGRMSGVSTHSMPPISYEDVEHQSDVERARILEEALAKLEEGGGRS